MDATPPPSDKSKPGVQDLCWIRIRSDSWILASIKGPSLLSLWNVSTGRCIWTYDASPEFLSCIRRDPFDFRHFCVLGLKGLLISVWVIGDGEEDVVVKEHRVVSKFCDSIELRKLESEVSNGVSSACSLSPAHAVFPLFVVKFCFSLNWKDILFVTFPKELVVFDLQYMTSLSANSLPRGCGKFLDVESDLDNDLLYCAHFDGKLSIWRRSKGEQVYTLCTMEALMPSIGTSVPSPTVISFILCRSEATMQCIGKLCSIPRPSSSTVNCDIPSASCRESPFVSKTYFISISDDGKVWYWLLTAENNRNVQNDVLNSHIVTDACEVTFTHTKPIAMSIHEPVFAVEESEPVNNIFSFSLNSISINVNFSFKISLVRQLHLLSSTVTVLAVPSPSLIATLTPVPLVALGTRSGIIDVIDVSANAVAASFSAHTGIIRGLRWLGNCHLVSFSYAQANEKVGGYINRLVVTCLRSGLNRSFRIFQMPERAPIRALRASSSGRYLLILFRDAPVEVWAMKKNPIMLRSIALPFTVLEWTLPTAPWTAQNGPSRQSSMLSKENMILASAAINSPTKASLEDSKSMSSEGSTDEISESFAFSLVNGAVGVFEVHGQRIRDLRPNWPSSSFVSFEGLLTAMACRLPHVVIGDRSGNIHWWDVTTGFSSSFDTHRGRIQRIKFSPVAGNHCRGCIAVLFYDNTFSIFDLDSQDPLANSFLQPHFPGTLVLELDWLPLQTDKNEPLVLCIAGADGSFRLIQISFNDKKVGLGSHSCAIKERFRPMPICSPILLPTPHALALQMILQLGVKPSWFNTHITTKDRSTSKIPETIASPWDSQSCMIDSLLPPVGDPLVPELLLQVLEPYRREGCILDDERSKLYATAANRSSAERFAFAAAVFGESSEALFWLQLPHALAHLLNKSASKSPQKYSALAFLDFGDTSTLNRMISKEKSMPRRRKMGNSSYGHLKLMAFEPEELWETANEHIRWHEKLEGEEAIQSRVHELVSIGNLEDAVNVLLATPSEGSYFYVNAIRAIALSSSVSTSLLELAVKVVAANVVRSEKSFCAIHLLCAIGRYQEACSQLQDAGCWTDAATLAAAHLQGSDYARVLHRWADHILHTEHNIWRALILYVAAGVLQPVLAALQDAQKPETAAMFLLACYEINAEITSKSGNLDELSRSPVGQRQSILPCLDPEHKDVIAVSEYYRQYQRKLLHLCIDSQPPFT